MGISIKEGPVLEVGDIKAEMMEKRPLPMGIKEFEEWSSRIIQGAMVGASERSLKFALASMVLHNLGPTESFKEDAYFIHCLRKSAANQVAHVVMNEIKDEQELEKKLAEATATKLEVIDGGVLEDKGLQDN